MYINAVGTIDDLVCGGAKQAAHASAQTNHQLGSIHRAGEFQQGVRYIIAFNNPPLAVQGFRELLQPPQTLGEVPAQSSIGAGDVDHQHLAANNAFGDPSTPADQSFGGLVALDRHHHSFAGGPIVLDLFFFPVFL